MTPFVADSPSRTESTKGFSCLACEGSMASRFSALQKKKVFPLLECRSCGLIRMEVFPPPVPATVKDTNPVLESFSPVLQWLKAEVILKPEIRRMRSTLKGKGPVLDVGCGTGWAASLWKTFGGMEVHGLEFQPAWADLAEKRFGLHIVRGRFEEALIPDNTYELVILRHVLEHFKDPSLVLNKVLRILKPGGYTLILVPNGTGLGRQLFGSYWIWAAPAHLYTYSPASLGRLLDRIGFRHVKTQHSPSPMLLAASVHNWLLVRGWNRLAAFFHPGSIFLNAILFPIAVAGKLLKRGEVITVLAQKDA